MNGFVFFQILVWLGMIGKGQTRLQSIIDDGNYRAALYSTEIDFSRYQQIVPEIQYTIPGLTTIAYKYIIQYGKDTLIDIMDPGDEIKAFTAMIRITVYSKKESTLTCFIDHARNYYTSKNSIPYSIEESKGSITDLCEGVELNSRCDSVTFTLDSVNTSYKVIFNDTIANLRSNFLLYPDIEYLPYKIFGIGQYKNTITLEDVIYGKSAIDSLLQLYDYEGYDQITDTDLIKSDGYQEVKDFVEKLRQH